MKKEIYLDNAASTPVDKEVLKAMNPYWSKIYGNPSSFNDAGRKAKETIDKSRKKIARILGAKTQEIIFTSSATEANNLAILGIIRSVKETNSLHVITTKIEHPAVLEPIKQAEKEKLITTTYLPVNSEGLINVSSLKKAIKSETVLVSIIYANNEIGAVQPIKKISKIIKQEKEKRKKLPLYFHTDAVQAVGHLDINVNNLGVDLMTISSHKIYGPKGIAALYVKRDTPLVPLFFGGGQEFNLRPSTEATPLIVGFSKALENITNNKTLNTQQAKLKKYFTDKLKKLFPEIKINGSQKPEESVPHIINITFPGIESEQILLYLDKHSIRASAGAACSSKDFKPSHVLTSIGLSKELARSSIRFSLGQQTTKADLDYAISVLVKIIKKIKKLYPGQLKKYYFFKS